jgi:hypothetical protein
MTDKDIAFESYAIWLGEQIQSGSTSTYTAEQCYTAGHEAARAESAKEIEAIGADTRRLTRLLDVALHGESGAAEQASLCDLIEPARRLREEIERLKRTTEWQPIDTAPTDTRVLIYGGKTRLASNDEWLEDNAVRLAKKYSGDHHYTVNGCFDSKPTHWMPLPDAPTAKKEEV